MMTLLFIFFLPSLIDSAVLKTSLGLIKGKELKAKDGSIVHVFKHIPFAKSPIGPLRYALPEKAEPWKGIWDATEYGPACMSNSSTTTSPQKWIDEDCLHNNIFVSDRCLRSKKGCAVVFYIHGGGFTYDSAVMFQDDVLVNNFGSKDVVLVISAFRLGFFSLLAFGSDDVIPTNLPIYDLKISLEWVQDNINDYGGDKRSVTIMGHSGGGAAVGALVFNKELDKKKLFKRAISMSGPAILAMDATTRRIKTWEYIQKAGCMPYPFISVPSNNYIREAVECLRTKDSLTLLAVQRQMEDEGYTPEGLVVPSKLFPSRQIYDFISDPPKVPMLMGSTLYEMDKWKEEDYSETIADMIGLTRPMAAAAKYHKDREEGKIGYSHVSQTDALFVGIHKMAQELTSVGADVYVYSYRNPRHAVHTDDLSYIMGVHAFQHDENEDVLAKLYPEYFINYIKNGRPDPDWEIYRMKDENYYSIDVNVTTGLKPQNALHYEKKVIDYWTIKMKAYDESLGSYEKRSAALPVIFVNDTNQYKRGYVFTPSNYNNYFNWTSVFIFLGLILSGFLIGRCSVSTTKREFLVRLPHERTPLFKDFK